MIGRGMGDMITAASLFILGAILGSFAVAQVWRLRVHQLVEDHAAGEKVARKELNRLKRLIRSPRHDRSECLSCHHPLAWYDLLPGISWISLRGRCRYCHAPIGSTEVLAELGLGAVFALSFLFWPHQLLSNLQLGHFALWLVACVLMAILFVYDAKWYLLPFRINLALIGVAIVIAGVVLAEAGWSSEVLGSMLLGVVFMAGIYFIFSLFGWVGLGDSILCVGLALIMGSWQYALLALFLANLFGCLMLIPIAVAGKLRRSMHIPFGPFLILGTLVTVLWGDTLIQLFFALMSAPAMMLMV